MRTVEPEQRFERLLILENRRLGIDSLLGQMPALIVAAQSFLLIVLTQEGLCWVVRWVIALAGVTASCVAGIAVAIQRDREVQFSELVTAEGDALGLGKLTRDDTGKWTWVLERSAWKLWLVVLAAFVVADLVVAAMPS